MGRREAGGGGGGGGGDRGGEVYRFHKSPLPVLQLSMRCYPPP